MRPFIELTIVIMNNEQHEKEVTARILPDEIEYYYPGFYQGTVVVMKSRSTYITMFSPEEFDQVLSAYHQAVKANAGNSEI